VALQTTRPGLQNVGETGLHRHPSRACERGNRALEWTQLGGAVKSSKTRSGGCFINSGVRTRKRVLGIDNPEAARASDRETGHRIYIKRKLKDRKGVIHGGKRRYIQKGILKGCQAQCY